MKDLSIIFENESQRTRLSLNNELLMIEEETLYIREDKKVTKCSLQREIYNEDTSLKCMEIFFYTQLNALIEFYRTKGGFSITIQ